MNATATQQQQPDDPLSTGRNGRKRLNGASYEHPVAFWVGVGLTTVGVLLQLPMFYSARTMNYHLAGMPMTDEMVIGMALIVAGVGCTFYGLFPQKQRTDIQLSKIGIGPLDDAPIRPAHIALLFVTAAAITIDVMKPVAFAFLTPGAATEYGLKGR